MPIQMHTDVTIEPLENRRLMSGATTIPLVVDPVGTPFAPAGRGTRDVESNSLIGLDAMRADARFADVDGRGYSVVVIDSAIDLDSPYFGPDLDGNGVADRIVYAYDFSGGNDADAQGTDDHGSNVSSIAVGQGGAHSPHAGMAPGANLIFLKVFPNSGASASTGDVNEALAWVVANAAAYNVVSVNLSLGYGNFSTARNSEGASYFAQLAAANVISVSAAGNDYYEYGDAQGVGNFAADPNVLAVSAVYDADLGGIDWGGPIDYTTGRDRVTSFSQRSATLTDIFAPGGAITGADSGGGSTDMYGTSQASPHVAGIVALAQQLAVRTIGRRLTFDEFRSLLQSTGATINDGDDEDDNVFNTGATFKRVDAYAMAKAIHAMAAPTTPGQLAGTPFGTGGSFNNNGNTVARAFDGDLNTYFDAAVANNVIAGLDLGSAKRIGSAKFAPRAGWSGRMVGGVFQASNDGGFLSSVTLGTIAAAPAAGTLTTLAFADAGTYRYVRYVAPNGSYGNVAELQFFSTGGTTTPPTTGAKLAGTPIGTGGSFGNGGNTIAKALDGDLNTYFDGPAANGNTVGLDLGAAATITSIAYASRSGFPARMNGGVFQASNSPTFAGGVVTLYTIGAAASPPSGSLTAQTVNAGGTYRYVRYVAPGGSYGNVAEVQFFGTGGTTPPPAPTLAKLTGTTIGTGGSFGGGASTIARAVDGDLNTYYDGATPSSNWVGLDLGTAKTIKQVGFAPRSGWAQRMVGGIFQGSNDASFAAATTLYTVASAPAVGTLTTAAVGVAAAFRYVRYLAPAGSYGNVAEVAFYA